MRLTFTIPFYAGPAYLADALESLRTQSDEQWNAVVFDDSAAKGEARALVESFRDARIAYRANPGTLGMVRCWNRCLAEAEGELVTLLHADDRLLSGYAATVKALAAAHPEAVAYFTAAETIDEHGARCFSLQDDIKRLFVPRGGTEVVLRGEAGLRTLVRGDFIVCPSLCFRRAQLGERRFAERWRQVQDLEFLARLLTDGETLVGARAQHYAYRRHAANATAQHTASLLRFEEEFALYAEIAAQAERHGWPRAAASARAKTILRLHLAWRVLSEFARLRLALATRTLGFLLTRR